MRAVFTKNIIISSLVVAVVYLIIVTYLMNYSFVIAVISGNSPISYKGSILVALLRGLGTSMTHFSLGMLILVALLTGANLTLLVQKLKLLRSSGKLHFLVGGSSIIGIVGSGCAVCGLPVLALLGLGGSLAYLPFHGTEISVIAAMLLAGSLYLMARSYAKACAIHQLKKTSLSITKLTL